MSIVPLNIGSGPNDGTGQDLRSGGQVINANFSELDQRTNAAQSAADGARAKADAAQAKADAAIPGSQKGQPNGVAELDATGTVPAIQLPSYVDDVLEFASFTALPATGETGKIYITIDTNSQYRWSGSQYILLTASPGSTDAVPEGSVNKYWTNARTLASLLTGFTLPTVAAAQVTSADSVLTALAKLQLAITGWMAPTIANLSAPAQSGASWTTSGTTNPIAGFPAGSQSYVIPAGTAADFTQLLFARTNPVRLGVRRSTAGALSQFTELAAYPTGTTVMDAANLPVMTGATASAPGKPGLAPAAAAGEQDKFLTAGGAYKEAGGAALPVGSIVPWPVSRSTLPAGWIARDGQLLNRADWPDLWALVSASAVTEAVWLAAPYGQRGKYSSGNGTTTFRMPDTNAKHADGNTIAAMFLRGDGKNSAGTPGLHQKDQVQGFRMGPLAPATGMVGTGAGSPAFGVTGTTATVQASTGGPVTDGVNGTPRIGSETRPSSETVIWCTVGAGKAINPGSVDVTALATTVSGQSNQLSTLGAQVADLGFGYSSAALAIVPGGVVTLNHGLGAPPQKFWIEATCTVADAGFSVGTVIRLNENTFAVAGNNYGCTVEISPTQLIVSVAATGYTIIRKDTRVIEKLTDASWTVKYKASKA